MSDISVYVDVEYIKLCIHNGTSVEELIAYLEDLNREKDYKLCVQGMICVDLREKEK